MRKGTGQVVCRDRHDRAERDAGQLMVSEIFNEELPMPRMMPAATGTGLTGLAK
ncbi:MAG: hypothetical protein IPM08_00130 [Actinomycetales bacterium]|nr:hypothetical protein [Actinomycetales bacterium]